LSSKFSSVLLAEFTVTYNIIEHLPAIDVFEKQIKMALGDDNVPHFTNIRMLK
jgi:hypothetical protein